MIAGQPRLKMPAFSVATASTVSPRYSAWSRTDRGDDGRCRTIDHVGGVDTPAEAHFEQEHVR